MPGLTARGLGRRPDSAPGRKGGIMSRRRASLALLVGPLFLLAIAVLVLPSCGTTDPNLPPTSAIDAPPPNTTVTLGNAVNFQGTANDPDGTVASHSWDFGDGSGATVEDPGAHTYASAGSYTVAYSVTDNQGYRSAPDSVVVTVEPPLVPPIAGLWKFREDVVGPSIRSIVTAELMIEQTGAVLDGEARRVIKTRVYNSSGVVAYEGAVAQTGLAGSADASQVQLHFSDTEGDETYSGTLDAAGDRMEGSGWHAVRSTDPPPPSVEAPTGLSATITPGPRVRLDWTDNSSNDQGFLMYRGCQGAALAALFTVGPEWTAAEDFVMPYGQDCSYTVKAYLWDTFENSTDQYTGPVFSAPSNTVTLSIPTSPVHGIAPDNGKIGDAAIVTGLDFGTDLSVLAVAVAGHPATMFMELVSSTQIRILMPNGGYEGRMPVTIWKNNQVYGEAAWTQANSADFFEPNNNTHSTDPLVYAPGQWVGSFASGDWQDWRQIGDTPLLGSPRRLEFHLDWNEDKDLDLHIMDSGGSREICGRQGIGSAKPIIFQCDVADDFGGVHALVVDEDAYSRGDTRLVSYKLEIRDP